MRMAPTRMQLPKAATVKTVGAEVKHISAPLKGLSLFSKLSVGDPLTATILRNFVIEDDRILSRAGYVQQCAGPTANPIEQLIPWYGDNPTLCGAQGGSLIRLSDGLAFKTGFTSNDWHWTSFANLGEAKYTVMVNGKDGVWSWDGAVDIDPSGPVAVTAITAANPAVLTVASTDIDKFVSGTFVNVTGATGTGWSNANGRHQIDTAGAPANSFKLVGVDTSAGIAPVPTTVMADPIRGVIKEAVTAPADATWVVPNQFQLVLSHQNRLWFADNTNLAVYYLPLQQKSGELQGMLPLNAVFKRGGSIRAMYTWTLEGGTGLNDLLVIFTSNGEAAIYAGIDPESDMRLDGVYRFDPPMSKHSVVNFGGELYVLIPTGVVPMSTMLRAETEKLGEIDRNVISLFLTEAITSLSRKGWQLFLNPSSGRLFANMPTGALNDYRQLVRHMPRTVWSEFRDVPARCWGWIDPFLYFGDDQGRIHRMHPSILNDNGKPIEVDVQGAWSNFGRPGLKQFKMIQPYLITDGDPKPLVEVKVDYDFSDPENEPDITLGVPGAMWDVADWATDTVEGEYWAAEGNRAVSFWQGVMGKGKVGAPRLQARLMNCRLALAGWDVTFEEGAIVG